MIFVRHPVTSAPPDFCYGRTDIGLGEGAEAQIATALQSVPRKARIVTSPLVRCRILADRLAARDGLAPEIDARLQEYDFGRWEGRLWSDIPRDESEPWTADILNRPAPGGESFVALIARVREALSRYDDDTLVVCHAGPIRAAHMILLDMPFDVVFARKIPFCQPLDLPARGIKCPASA